MRRGLQVTVSRQGGIALLLLVVTIALAAMSYFVSTMSTAEMRLKRVDSTAGALQRAKQALIAYAVTYGDIDADTNGVPDFPGEYGFLPCPDYNAGLSEGLEDNGNCGAQSVSRLGYLPWRTLGLPGLKDESGTCLMYAVSGDYKNDESAFPSNKASLLNEDSHGMFQVVDDGGTVLQGLNPDERVVAIILAPGLPLQGQSRSVDAAGTVCGEDYANYSAYLDAVGGIDNSTVSNAAYQLDQFVHANTESAGGNALNPYNDRFVTITREEIWQALTARSDFVQKMTDLAEALTMCLSSYAAVNGLGRLPWPVQADLADSQLNSSYDDNDDDSPGYAGRLPFIVDDSNGDIGMAGSSELFAIAGCNALTVSSGAVVDLQTAGSEYRKLWDNWKDHFFYVVSQDHAPDNVSAVCGGDCITVDGTQRAGLVIFGGFREAGQSRTGPVAGDPDTKFDVANYVENGNKDEFPDSDGDGSYNTAGTNDIMYCLTAAVPPLKSPC
jgi:hypothetical protein